MSVGRQGLWSVPGDGVLARQRDLILLSAIDEHGLLDNLLDLLAKTSEVGGDGRRFADAVEDLIEGDETWGGSEEGQPGPAVVAFGPAGAGLAVTVCGTAWAPSRSTRAFHECAISTTLRAGLTVPSALETCTMATNFVLGPSSFSNSSSNSSPSSLIGATRSLAPCCSQRICQGTMLE